ncbi:MAG: M56 family metallopeptidase [Capsulimonas sp.]|uniref:M56 family metallopeptidase n=1 Tax=Capsulimonas sp. TaxID=2494211 RepID=UPI003264CC62
MNSEMLFELCRSAIQSGIVLLLQSCAVLLAGMGIGRAAHRFGPFVQSFVYRMTLATLAVLILTSVYAAPSMRVLWRISLPSHHIAQSAPLSVGAPPLVNAVQPMQGSETAAPSSTPVSSVAGANVWGDLSSATQKAASATKPSWTAGAEPYFVGVALWVVVALLLLGRIAYGQIGLALLRRNGVLISTGSEADMVLELCRERSIQPLPLRLVPGIRGPLLAGAWRPEIWLPEDFVGNMEPGVLRAVLAHEIAHFERSDNAWMLLARVLRALMWPQALLWALRAEMAKSAENACDALVVDGGCPRHEYAECLLLLTERLAPSRWERSLGASAVPFRSQIGRRIQALMSASRTPRTPSGWMKAGAAGAAVLLIVGALTLVSTGGRRTWVVDNSETAWSASPGYLSQFTLPAENGWKAAPVMLPSIFEQPTVEHPAPSVLSDEERDLVRSCHQNAAYYMESIDGVSSLHDRRELENILAKHPHFFFAEYLLGVWCAHAGDEAGHQRWLAQSLQDAPAVLAGRIQFDDGRPVPGYTFKPNIAYYSSAYFMEEHSDYNDTQRLDYPDVTTDAHGCFYLPAFHAIAQMIGWSASTAKKSSSNSGAAKAARKMVMMPPQGLTDGLIRFRSTERVGVMPPIVVRPYMQWLSPISAASQSMDHPEKIHGATMKIAWKPFPGAVTYDAHMVEIVRHGAGYTQTDVGYETNEPHFHGSHGNPSTEMTLALNGNQPTFYRGRVYQIVISPRDAQGRQLSNTYDYNFQPLDALAPLALSKTNVLKTFPPGVTIASFQQTGNLTVIRGTMPTPVNLQMVTDRDFFGLKLDHILTKSHYVGSVNRNDMTFEIAYKH